MSFFSKTKTKVYEPKTSRLARTQLYELGMADETMPTLQVAGADPLSRSVYGTIRDRLANPDTAAYDTAMGAANRMVTEGQDPTQTAGFRGIWNRVLEEGTAGGRNLQRALKLSGNAPAKSSQGLDAIGRQTTGVQEQLMAASLPYLDAAQARQLQAMQALANLQAAKEASQQSWLGLGQRTADYMRNIEQAVADAEFNQAMQQLAFQYQIQPGILQSVLVNPYVYQKYDPGFVGYTNQLSQHIKDAGNIAATGQGMGSMAGGQSWNGSMGGMSGGSMMGGSSMGNMSSAAQSYGGSFNAPVSSGTAFA